eukprot:310438_1
MFTVFSLLVILFHVFTSKSTTPTASPTEPPYDGIIREQTNEDGRLSAILEPAYAMNHCANLHFISSTKTLAISWFTGCAEGGNDTSDALSRISINDLKVGGKWDSPNIISQDVSYSDQNPLIFTDETNNNLHLFYTRQQVSVPPNQNESQVMHRVNYDGTGNEFGNESMIFSEYGSFVRQPMLTRLDGSWMLPMYYGGSCFIGNQTNETLNNGTCLCYDYPYIMVNDKHDVNTKNWRKVMFGTMNQTRCLVQPSVIRLKPNKPDLRVYFRDRRHQWIYTAYSSDDGETWTVPKPTQIRNNDGSIQAYTMKTGHIGLVCNPQNYTYPRDPLIVALSEDGGETFPYKRYLEHHFDCPTNNTLYPRCANETGVDYYNNKYTFFNDIPPIPNCSFYPHGPDRYAYPSIFQLPNDDKIHVAYTWQRRAIKWSMIDEEWIKKGNVTNLGW